MEVPGLPLRGSYERPVPAELWVQSSKDRKPPRAEPRAAGRPWRNCTGRWGKGRKPCLGTYSPCGLADCPARHPRASQICLCSPTSPPSRWAGGLGPDGDGRRDLLGARVRTGVAGTYPCDPQDSTQRFFLNGLFVCLAKQAMGAESRNRLKSSGHERPLPCGTRGSVVAQGTFGP